MPVPCHDCGGEKQGFIGRCEDISACRLRREDELNAKRKAAAENDAKRKQADTALQRAIGRLSG